MELWCRRLTKWKGLGESLLLEPPESPRIRKMLSVAMTDRWFRDASRLDECAVVVVVVAAAAAAALNMYIFSICDKVGLKHRADL